MAERVHLIRIGYGYAITGSLPPAAIGDPYSRTLTAIGGVGIKRLEILAENVTDAIVFTDNGDNTATFAMADPQTAGTYSVTVRATDANRQRWTRTFTFQVVALPLAMSGSLANCTVGSAYSDTLTVSGGVQPYSLDSYTLPAGLSAILSGDTITISGTPTGAGLGPGTSFNFDTDFSVSDSIAGDVEYEQTITISVTAVTAVFDPTPLLDATGGVAYTADTNASGGTGGYTFTKQAGPTWLSVNSSTGALTGTPDSGDIGTGITVTVRATDSEGNYDDVTDTISVVAGIDLLTGLMSWWELGEASGNRADSHGARNLSPTGTVSQVAGLVGNASSTASTGNYLSGSSPDVTSGDFTIAGVFKTSNANYGIAGHCSAVGWPTHRRWFVGIEAGNAFFTVITDGVNAAATTYPVGSSLGDGAFHTFVMWRDTAANLIYTQIDNGTPVSASFSGASTLYNGGGGLVMHQLNDFYGGGVNDNIGIWNRMLTADERAWLYNSGAWRAYADL